MTLHGAPAGEAQAEQEDAEPRPHEQHHRDQQWNDALGAEGSSAEKDCAGYSYDNEQSLKVGEMPPTVLTHRSRPISSVWPTSFSLAEATGM
jgi:hypothetical protein